MSDTVMLVNVVEEEEARIAILEDGKLQELYVERASADNIVGNIYKGSVVNIAANIEAAFVEFGHKKHGFLHISDVRPRSGGNGPARGRDDRARQGDIRKLLRNGDKVIVQVTKEGIGDKGKIGERGRDGLDGFDGKPGRPGDKGPKGDRGQQGEQGSKGNEGPPSERTKELSKRDRERIINEVARTLPYPGPGVAITPGAAFGAGVIQLTNISKATTLAGGTQVILCDASSASFTVTLPTASSAKGRAYHIKKTDNSGNVVTVSGNGATIDGESTQVINIQYDSMMTISDGTVWHII